jgi:hypothetical protein
MTREGIKHGVGRRIVINMTCQCIGTVYRYQSGGTPPAALSEFLQSRSMRMTNDYLRLLFHARSFTSDRNEMLQELVQNELQTTISDHKTRDGMGRDKPVCYHLGSTILCHFKN